MGLLVRSIFMCILCLLGSLLYDPGLPVSFGGPEDERADEAERAVQRLGPGRGAVDIRGNSVDIRAHTVGIQGLESVPYSETSVDIDQALKDLGARKAGQEIQISLSGDVLFDFDRSDIKKEAEATLTRLAGLIQGLNKRRVLVEGYTDSKGSEAYNLKLSTERAEAVKRWLLSKGRVQQVRIEVKGYGEEKPVAPNTHPDGTDYPEGRAQNRRVEIRITD